MRLPTLKIIKRDLKLLEGHTKTLFQLKWLDANGKTVGKVFDSHAKKNPDKICFYYENEKWTFRQVEEVSNKLGNYFSKEGFKSSDAISLFMENRPEYVCTWLGLSKIGIVAALINYNLRSVSLKHCLDVAKSKALICGTELTGAVAEVQKESGELPYPIYLYSPQNPKSTTSSIYDSTFKNLKDLNKAIVNVSSETPKLPENSVNFRSPLFYCFTSGTTGFPKPAIITHSRFFMAACVNHYASELTESDRIYMTLPLYHVAGGVLGLSQTLVWGTPLIIRNGFSARNFWKDCIHYEATASQYIAETCRFLLRLPPTPEDSKHKLRLMFGNGFRRDIWGEFTSRFNISKITEFYASTEGNANLVNYDNTQGAVGYIPPWLQKKYPIVLVKIDEESGELIRDPVSNLVVRCKPGEQGELIGKVVINSPLRDFKGYADDQAANEKKLIRNVFKKGDTYFRTGDKLFKDVDGYHYFQDRMGDSFRWKSENVSTAEVESIVSSFCQLKDTVVFGVKVPGYDGTAGMCVIADPDNSLDLNKLEEGVKKSLPVYARPLFLRIVKEIAMTGTHKLKKTDLAREGYDLSKILEGEKIYVLSKGEKYLPLTKVQYEQILEEKINL